MTTLLQFEKLLHKILQRCAGKVLKLANEHLKVKKNFLARWRSPCIIVQVQLLEHLHCLNYLKHVADVANYGDTCWQWQLCWDSSWAWQVREQVQSMIGIFDCWSWSNYYRALLTFSCGYQLEVLCFGVLYLSCIFVFLVLYFVLYFWTDLVRALQILLDG